MAAGVVFSSSSFSFILRVALHHVHFSFRSSRSLKLSYHASSAQASGEWSVGEEGSLVSFTHMALELGKRNDIFIDSFLEDIGLGWLARFRLLQFRLV
jgi:hypothetical protein